MFYFYWTPSLIYEQTGQEIEKYWIKTTKAFGNDVSNYRHITFLNKLTTFTNEELGANTTWDGKVSLEKTSLEIYSFHFSYHIILL